MSAISCVTSDRQKVHSICEDHTDCVKTRMEMSGTGQMDARRRLGEMMTFYCNGLLACPPAWHMTRLQSVLHAAARFVLQLPGCAPVSAAMCDSLHWLAFPQRVTYKLCLLTYKCLHGLAPPCLARMCIPVSALPGRSQLRAADKYFLFVPHTRTVTLGPRAFCSSGPASWNSLPAHLRDPVLSLNVFCEHLKTVLFAV